MKRLYMKGVVTLIGCIFPGFMTSCLDDDSVDVGPLSSVSLYHASPDAPDLDILVDNEKINNVPFTYGLNTGYLFFSSGARNLRFVPYGGTTTVIDTVLTLEPEKDFSIFVIDEFERASVMMLFDDPSPPAASNAKIRFINLSPDSNPISLKIKDVALPLTVGQSFTEASNFMDIEGKDYHFEIVSGGVVIDEIPNAQLQSGWFYNIIVRGFVAPPSGNTNALDAQLSTN